MRNEMKRSDKAIFGSILIILLVFIVGNGIYTVRRKVPFKLVDPVERLKEEMKKERDTIPVTQGDSTLDPDEIQDNILEEAAHAPATHFLGEGEYKRFPPMRIVGKAPAKHKVKRPAAPKSQATPTKPAPHKFATQEEPMQQIYSCSRYTGRSSMMFDYMCVKHDYLIGDARHLMTPAEYDAALRRAKQEEDKVRQRIRYQQVAIASLK